MNNPVNFTRRYSCEKFFRQALLFALVCSVTLSACKKDDPDDDDNTTGSKPYESGVLIVNEGPFGSGTGTVAFFNRSTGAISQDIFQTANGYPLGNIVQSASVYNGKTYVVVNNANKMEVVNAADFKATGSLTGLNNPRYFLGLTTGKGYLTEWGPTGVEGAVHVVDLPTLTITATLAAGKGAERMVAADQKVFVACSGGYDKDSVVTVVDANTDKVLTHVEVGPNPNSLQVDANGKIWVLCGGRWNSSYTAIEAPGRLVRMDASTYAIELSLDFAATSTVSGLVINTAGDKLYYKYDGKVFTHDISATTLNTSPFVSRGFYGLGVDPVNDYLYASDPVDYSSNGKVLRYTPSGAVVDSFSVGVIPGNFWFY